VTSLSDALAGAQASLVPPQRPPRETPAARVEAIVSELHAVLAPARSG